MRSRRSQPASSSAGAFGPGPADARSITDLAALVASLPTEDRARFDRIYHLDVTMGQVVPPEAMHPWIGKHFGSVDAVRRQRIVKVTNKVTLEGALFNQLRASRPMEAPACDGDLETIVEKQVGGPFCHPTEGTPADTFGRIRGRSCITAANIAMYDGWHAVVVFDEHHPLHFSADGVVDYVDTALQWVRTAHQIDSQACYPFFLWNCLWRSGASILHGHAQVTLTRGMHYARVEHWRQAAQGYRQQSGVDYFTDLIATHRALDLALDHGTAAILSSLTPFKEMETHIIGARLDGDLKSALYRVLHTLVERLGVQSFNVALYHPPLSSTPESWADFPYVFRILDRGNLGNNTSDVGSMEFFGQSVVATDPFRVAEALRAGANDGEETSESCHPPH